MTEYTLVPRFRGIVTEKCSCCDNWRECAHFWTPRNQGYVCEECAGIAVAAFQSKGRRAVECGEVISTEELRKCCPGCGDQGVQQITNEFDEPEWCIAGLQDEDGGPVYICFCPWCSRQLADPSEAPMRVSITTEARKLTSEARLRAPERVRRYIAEHPAVQVGTISSTATKSLRDLTTNKEREHLRALLTQALQYMRLCRCLRPATYARALCDLCDECAADSSLEWSDPPGKEACLLAQAVFVRRALQATLRA